MASVFLSYDRDDTSRAKHFATALEKAGHSVWWDLHVRGGAQFSKVIEEALKAADVVVVLWSVNSVESAWVRDEAAAGRDNNRLVPVTIDGTLPPLGFRQFQTVDLSRWKGRGTPAGVRALLADVDGFGKDEDSPDTSRQPQRASVGNRPASTLARPLIAALAVFAILTGAGIYWLLSAHKAGVPTIALEAADHSAPSRSMARDLLVKLGNLQAVKSGSMTLVDGEGNAGRADLLFQAADTSNRDGPTATLTLLGGNDHALLWSKAFDQPSGNASDLKQQVAVTAGRVLGCALEGFSGNGHRLAAQTLKTYLNACAQLADVASADPTPVIPMLRKVTREAPHFAPGWGKLLMAQSTVAGLSFTNGVVNEPARADLRGMIDEARDLNPGIAEADLAETALLPVTAYARRLALIDQAARRSPDNPQALLYRASALVAVGRMAEAVEDSDRAAQLDQLSPALAGNLMAALAFAGQLGPAREQLADIEKLWPGTATATSARWLFYFRYGDPKIAAKMEPALRGTSGVPYFIEARINPSPANVDRLVTFLRARKDKLGTNAGPNRLAYYTLAMGLFHRDDELFDTLMSWDNPSDLALMEGAYFRPELRDFRKQPRFLRVMKRAGLLDYWRTSGKWPDFCFDADMPYDCKAEVAKLA
jgi:tetratricopeptide (TPR) repeat protein